MAVLSLLGGLALTVFLQRAYARQKAGASDRGIRLKSKRKLKSPFSEVKFGFSKGEFDLNSALKNQDKISNLTRSFSSARSVKTAIRSSA